MLFEIKVISKISYRINTGNVYFEGNAIEFGNTGNTIKLGIGMVHQHFTLAENLTVLENIIIGRQSIFSLSLPKRQARVKILELSKKFGLPINPDELVANLSVSEKQRIEILKTLFLDCKLLILDEPTAGVDVELRQEMWKVVQSLRETGVTIILTTHYIEEAEAIADRVGVINQGEIVIVEKKSELLKKMGNKKLKVELQQEINEIPSSLEKYNLLIGSNKMSLDYTYDLKEKQTGITNLLQDIKDSGLKLRAPKTHPPPLEKIFVTLVRENNEN